MAVGVMGCTTRQLIARSFLVPYICKGPRGGKWSAWSSRDICQRNLLCVPPLLAPTCTLTTASCACRRARAAMNALVLPATDALYASLIAAIAAALALDTAQDAWVPNLTARRLEEPQLRRGEGARRGG